MKRFLILLASVLLVCSCATTQSDVTRLIPKGQQALTEWEFSRDGDSWEKVTVPHSYNAVDGRSA